MPETKLGKVSVLLIIAMPVLFLIGSTLAGLLYRGLSAGSSITEDLMARPALALAMLAGMVCGISAFLTGLFAIVRQKENALSVYLATSIGGMLIVFLAGEFLFPH
jgi:hypothetical protein